jgi:hypothetical protein
VFPVRYELDLYILFRRKSVFKGLKPQHVYVINDHLQGENRLLNKTLQFLSMNKRREMSKSDVL